MSGFARLWRVMMMMICPAVSKLVFATFPTVVFRLATVPPLRTAFLIFAVVGPSIYVSASPFMGSLGRIMTMFSFTIMAA